MLDKKRILEEAKSNFEAVKSVYYYLLFYSNAYIYRDELKSVYSDYGLFASELLRRQDACEARIRKCEKILNSFLNRARTDKKLLVQLLRESQEEVKKTNDLYNIIARILQALA
jgi:hypothetical protein